MPIERKKLLVIVGAGASAEASLPTGKELIKFIKEDLDFRVDFDSKNGTPKSLNYQALKSRIAKTKEDFSVFKRAALSISDAINMARSIDSYLHAHQDDDALQLCGKLAIVSRILERERQSKVLKALDDISRTFPEHSWWYYKFFELLTDQCNAHDLLSRLASVAFVIFNYDRCLEHFLYHAFQVYYRIHAKQAAALVNAIEIFHPYGTVGKLAWQDSKNYVPFGGTVGPSRLLELTSEIRTYGEKTELVAEPTFQFRLRETVKLAESFLFLGFGFLDINMNLMSPDYSRDDVTEARKVYATVHGVSEPNQNMIRDKIRKLTKSDHYFIYLQDKKCNALLEWYSESLKFD